MKFIVAITGASGVEIGKRVAEFLSNGHEVHLIVSNAATTVAKYELGSENFVTASKNIFTYNENQIEAILASGSNKFDGMIVAPCSMKTLSAISNGFAYNLIVRAADVCIKEKRPLVIVPRESPLSPIHLENMLKLSKLWVFIVPPIVQFYSAKEKTEQIDCVCGKILDCLNIEHKLSKNWRSKL